MLTSLLETKNIIMISSILLLLPLYISLELGLPINFLEAISVFMFLLAALLNSYFIYSTGVLKHPSVALFLMTIFMLAFISDIYNYQLSATFLFGSALFYLTQKLDEKKVKIFSVLDIGMVFSFLAIIYLPNIFLIVPVLFAIFAFTNFGFSGVLMLVFGGFLPVLILIQVFFIADLHVFWNTIDFPPIRIVEWEDTLFILSPFLVALVFSLLDYVTNNNRIELDQRHRYFLLGIFFLFWVSILAFFIGNNYDWFVIICLPVSLFLSISLEFVKKQRTREFLLWLIASPLLVYIFKDQIPLKEIIEWLQIL